MREISSETIYEAAKKAWIEIAFELPGDVKKSIQEALKKESSPRGRDVLSQILENAKLAESEKIPLCQDTGFPSVFVELGQSVIIQGEAPRGAIEKAIFDGTEEGFIRSSIVRGPFDRKNTGGNIPPVVYFDAGRGEDFRMTVSAKGAGSENASLLAMLNPGEGSAGAGKAVADHVIRYAANACPPLVIGVGIGGTADKAALMAKKACLAVLDDGNSPEHDFEKEILDKINSSGIGPGGFGGDTTALAVNVKTFACHMASLPVAVSINCHAVRRKEILL